MTPASGPRQKRSLGQVFLTGDGPCRRMVARLKDWGARDILEIGPGAGVLTGVLLEEGFRVTAVEKDDRFAKSVEERFEEQTSSLTVERTDVIHFDLEAWIHGAASPRAVVGNIPYNLSTPILLHLLPHLSQLEGVLLMTQKEFADRLAAPPGGKDYGSLSVFVQLRARVAREFSVGRGSFRPVPKVDSAVVSLRPREEHEPADILALTEAVTRAAFQKRRKTLRNSLQSYFPDGWDEGAPVSATARPETLSPEDFVALARFLKDAKKA